MVTTPNEFTLELYRQAWQQARHNELLRAGYVALYTLVVATVVGLLGQDKFRYPVGPYCFLGFLSLLGVLLSWRFAANANRWTFLHKHSFIIHCIKPALLHTTAGPSRYEKKYRKLQVKNN